MMLSPAVVGNFWAFLYQPQIGLFNYVGRRSSPAFPPSSFEMLGSVRLAPWAIIIVDTWMWTPYVMLICLAGLRSIPDYIYEAAEVDRASTWRQFWSITLPMALPFIMLAVLFRGIENFKMFDMVNLLTSGGPGSTTEVASITLKREAFEKWRTGYSSAFAIILFVTVFGLANIYVKALNRVKTEMSRRIARPFGRRAKPAARAASLATIVVLYALDHDGAAGLDLPDGLQVAAGLDHLSAQGRLSAVARGLLQSFHHTLAPDARIHRAACRRRQACCDESPARATWWSPARRTIVPRFVNSLIIAFGSTALVGRPRRLSRPTRSRASRCRSRTTCCSSSCRRG